MTRWTYVINMQAANCNYYYRHCHMKPGIVLSSRPAPHLQYPPSQTTIINMSNFLVAVFFLAISANAFSPDRWHQRFPTFLSTKNGFVYCQSSSSSLWAALSEPICDYQQVTIPTSQTGPPRQKIAHRCLTD